jgi:hypothetical protein
VSPRSLLTIDLVEPLGELKQVEFVGIGGVGGAVDAIWVAKEVINGFGHADYHAMELRELLSGTYWTAFTSRKQQDGEKRSHDGTCRKWG